MKCLYFLVLDKIDRTKLNRVFYRHYAGLPARAIEEMVPDCHREIIVPRLFPQARECVAGHLAQGREVVFVTGSVDFVIRPLADMLSVVHILAPTLLREDGRFTGELDGPPVAGEEKGRRLREFARQHEIDLSGSHAYGDSVADLPMLEAAGHAHAVNPDRTLAAIASKRGWEVHHWRTRPGG
jgi:HAD superfamily hydrolase (TIGR01490 family)